MESLIKVTARSCVGSFPNCWKLWHGCAYACLCVTVCLCGRRAVLLGSVTATISAVYISVYVTACP